MAFSYAAEGFGAVDISSNWCRESLLVPLHVRRACLGTGHGSELYVGLNPPEDELLPGESNVLVNPVDGGADRAEEQGGAVLVGHRDDVHLRQPVEALQAHVGKLVGRTPDATTIDTQTAVEAGR